MALLSPCSHDRPAGDPASRPVRGAPARAPRGLDVARPLGASIDQQRPQPRERKLRNPCPPGRYLSPLAQSCERVHHSVGARLHRTAAQPSAGGPRRPSRAAARASSMISAGVIGASIAQGPPGSPARGRRRPRLRHEEPPENPVPAVRKIQSAMRRREPARAGKGRFAGHARDAVPPRRKLIPFACRKPTPALPPQAAA